MATRKSNQVFIAKGGKAFGPITSDKLETLRRTGELEKFSWIWDFERNDWKPLDPAPGPLAYNGKSDEENDRIQENIMAICHDFRSAVSGQINEVSDFGCEFFTDENFSHPPLVDKSNVHLNLLNQRTGKAMNVQATVDGIIRSNHGWTFRIKWENCPQIL